MLTLPTLAAPLIRMEKHVIDLGQYVTKGVTVLAGRERGELARSKLDLTRLDEEGVRFEVRVPESLATVTMSFFLGLLADSVRTLTPDAFRERYVFSGPYAEEMREELIVTAMRTASPLGRRA
jgi:hypothetical protein